MIPWPFWGAGAECADAVSFSARTVVQHGLEDPSITLTPRVSGSLRVELGCGVGDRRYALQEALVPGRPIVLELAGLPLGTWECSGRVDLDADGGSGQMPLRFTVASVEPLSLRAGDDDILHLQRILKVHPNRPLVEATAEVIGAGGQHLEDLRADLSEPAMPVFQWSSGEEVVKIQVLGTDAHGFRAKLDLSPWWVEIPHEDVVFPTGSHAIPVAETGKLEHSWDEIARVFATYGTVVDVRLYVAGYTDTVGTEVSNQGLSERRARSIAGWFRERGFRGEIHFQGFGESVLALVTPDETDEAANRRAVYVLAAMAPPISPLLPRGDWRRL